MASRRILIIDDQIEIWEIVRLSLKLVAGWEVLTASTGAAGLEVAARELPDAILLDQMMPEMDGISTFQRLQGDPATSQIPVIIITASEHGDTRRYLDLGIKAVITKPFTPLNLAGRVADILGWEK